MINLLLIHQYYIIDDSDSTEQPEPPEVAKHVSNGNVIELSIINNRQNSHWDLYYYLISVRDEAGNVLTSNTTRDTSIIVPNHPNVSTIEVVTKTRCSQASPPRIVNIAHGNTYSIATTTDHEQIVTTSGAKTSFINLFSLTAIAIVTQILYF